MKRLLLIHPSTRRDAAAISSAKYWGMPPLGLAYVAAVTPPDWSVRIVDEHLEPVPQGEAPDLVGISAMTQNAPRAYRISRSFREIGVPTVLGGIHPSMMHEEALQHADSVVIGEAEWTWPKVLHDVERGALQPKYVGERASLDQIPVPRRDLLSKRYKMTTVNAARGCPFSCDFCSVTAFNGGTYRKRTVASVLAELQTIEHEVFYFADDNLYGSGPAARRWLIDFCQGLIASGMKKYWGSQVGIDFSEDDEVLRLAYKSGCRGVYIGFESIDPDSLGEMHKVANIRVGPERYAERVARIRRAGIGVVGAFVVGSGQDDVRSFKRLSDFLDRASIDVAALMVLTPLPGTALWQRMQDEGRVIYRNYPEDWEKFDTTQVVFVPRKMTVDELARGYQYLVSKRFSRRKVAYGFLRTLAGTRSLMASVLALGLNKGNRYFKVHSRDFDSFC